MATVSVEMLKTMLAEYDCPDLASLDISNVVSQFRDLTPAIETYVFNDGSAKDLVRLRGTVPVQHKGTMYNTPVCIWFLHTYPYNPPICFVKPTGAMVIKTGKHVDAHGKIYLPYLREWKHAESDLCGLIQAMIVLFGEHPPVFSRPEIQGHLLTPQIQGHLLTPRSPSVVRRSSLPGHLYLLAETGISTTGSQNNGTAALSTSDQTELASDESKPSGTLSTPETGPAAVSAPELLPSALASLSFSEDRVPAAERSALLRHKIQLEIDVLQRQKKVLEIQEQYYAIKLRRLLDSSV